MKRAPLTVLALVVVASTFGKEPAPTVTFVSPCECIAFHGVNRWVAKTDLSPVPSDKSAIQAITPSQIYAWEGLGPNVDITDYTEARVPAEQKWYALTGRVVDAKVKADGDIHLALQDATGDKPGVVVCEVPAKPQWCEIRTTIFSWRCPKKDWKPLARERKPTL